MKDRSLHYFLVTAFGIGAVVILLISWLTPMPINERVILTFFAVIGAAWAWIVH